MSRATPTDLGRDLVKFFEDFLPAQRGLSPHTIRSYRDALVLLLQFASRDSKRPVERLDIPDLTCERHRKVSRLARDGAAQRHRHS
jgi:site-specific recombinase XerC